MFKEEMVQLAKQLETAEELEILAEESTHLILWDGGKESVVRFPEKMDKMALLNEIVDIGSCPIERNKLIALLATLDASLYVNVQKIIFFETEEEYEELMVRHFDNTDMIDVDNELGKYLYFEDWVLINMQLIKQCAKELTYSDEDYVEELNIGLWTTLLHELRHGYQFTYLFEEEVDEEEDAEMHGIRLFEDDIRTLDYVVVH